MSRHHDAAVAGRKRPLDEGVSKNKKGDEIQLCSFCQAAPAAVMVPLPSLRSKISKPIRTPFCLLHYYTTSACRVGGVAESGGVTVINPAALQTQLAPQQDLFAEAYVQLQQELQEAAMQQYATHKDDPLAILIDLNKSSKRRNSMKAPPVRKKKDSPDGGFLRDVQIPERLLRIQQQQLKQQHDLISRMNRASDTTQRRKPTRKSIWNVMLDDDRKPAAAPRQGAPTLSTAGDVLDNDRTCTCGSDKVETVSSNSSNRNQDMAKAETRGNKDRGGEIVTRFRCRDCGKTWNEEE
jgi:hypothetical protein